MHPPTMQHNSTEEITLRYQYAIEQQTEDNPFWHIGIPFDRGFDLERCRALVATYRANMPENSYRIIRRLAGTAEVVE